MISCVLYGLTISRLFQGIMGDKDSGERSGVAVAALGLIPLSGVIFSVVLACKISFGFIGAFPHILQILNLVFAVISMLLLGGYGVSRSTQT